MKNKQKKKLPKKLLIFDGILISILVYLNLITGEQISYRMSSHGYMVKIITYGPMNGVSNAVFILFIGLMLYITYVGWIEQL